MTTVTYNRVPMFRNDHACSLLIDALTATRLKEPFKLIGYVIMPDHFHMLANPLGLHISIPAGRLKGRSSSLILKWLRAQNHLLSLAKLELPVPLESGQTHAVWLKEFSAIDIWSHKFIRQKLLYIHMNPVRAGLCDHPGMWQWSSYHAYFPHQLGSPPIEVDHRWLWTEEELNAKVGGQVRCLNGG